MKKLTISSDISLPLDAVTQTFGILAVKGSGKTYTASVLAEEMLRYGQQIVAIDVTGAWYGLKSSANGKAEGFPVVIFGGDQADVPLEEHSGEIIAQAIVENGFSAIIDLSLLRKSQMNRFLAIFLETLYRLNRKPLHLFADEADDYCPQKMFGPEQARTVGAMEDIVKRGRKKGIGCSLITQRPAAINKDVLTQCEILIALRMSHPRDINAIKEWINVHSSIDQAKEMIESLPSLKTGVAYIWSPSWLKVFEQIKIRLRHTFDSGATPKPGEKAIVPTKLAAVDIEKLGKEIQKTIDKQKAEDPRELKKKIISLERQLSDETEAKRMIEKVAENVNVADQKELKQSNKELKHTVSEYEKQRASFCKTVFNSCSRLLKNISEFETQLKEIQNITQSGFKPIDMPDEKEAYTPNPRIAYSVQEGKFGNLPKVEQAISLDGKKKLGACERAILVVLAQRYPVATTKPQLSILSGYSIKSSGFSNALSLLNTSGLIRKAGDLIEINTAGISVIGDVPKIPTGRKLQDYWLNKLGKAEREILKGLLSVQGQPITKQSISSYSGYSMTSSGFANALSKLRTLQLIEGTQEIKAADIFFE
jgi:uncharacterized protein